MKAPKSDYFESVSKTNPFAQMDINIVEADVNRVDNTWNKVVTFFPYYRLYYIRDGHARMHLSDAELDLCPNNIYFIPAFSVAGADCEDTLDHLWFHFHLDFGTVNYLSIIKPALSVPANPHDEAIFEDIISSFRSPDYDSPVVRLRVDGLCRYIFSRFLPQNYESDHLSALSRFIPVLQYIDAHLSEKISNADLAALMYLNTNYFADLFTRQFSMPPKQYVLHKRISAAATMLLENDRTVKEIAFSLGFENEIYFNRLFKKFTGVPPGAYRKLNSPPPDKIR